jgi:hypothetical protein
VIFREKASAKDIKNRPQLAKALDELGTGDVLVLANGIGQRVACWKASTSWSGSTSVAP